MPNNTESNPFDTEDGDSPFGEPADEPDSEEEDLFGGMTDLDHPDAVSQWDLPIGWYEATLIDASRGEGNQTGNALIILTWRLTGDWMGADGRSDLTEAEQGKGTEWKMWVVLEPPTAIFTAQRVGKVLEIPTVRGDDGCLRFRATRDEIVGRYAVLKMVKEDYEGDMITKPKTLRKHPEGPTHGD